MAGKKEVWSNVKIEISTVLATAIAISGITLGVSTVVSYGAGATDPVNGDEVYLSVIGTPELDGKVFRVASADPTANTFVLEGFDGTGLDPFVSGTFQKITSYANSGIITAVNASGGDAKYASTTTVHDSIESEIPTVLSPMKMDFDALFVLTDPFLVEARKASQTKTLRMVRVRFPSGTRMLGACFVSASGVPTGSAQDLVKTKMALSFQGLPNLYAS